MQTLYKLTDQDNRTQNNTIWGIGVTHTAADGEPVLCTGTVIHAYEHPVIALCLNLIHANIQNPKLWEAEGEIVIEEDQLMCGVKSLTTIREIPLPQVTTINRIAFGVLCAKQFYANPEWNKWADNWLSGKGRSKTAAARVAAKAANVAYYDAAYAARAACHAAYAAAADDADRAVAHVAYAAAYAGHCVSSATNLIALAEQALSIE